MNAPAGSAPLSDEETARLLTLTGEADSVELKVTVPESRSGYRSAIAALDIDPLAAELRQVFFFDTPDLTLNRHGVVLRARRTQGTVDDSVVKLRPVIPGELSGKLRKRHEFVVEVDVLPGGFVCSASFEAKLGPTDVRATALGKQPIGTLFTKGQREFFAEHAPEGVALDDLALLGPVTVLKLKFSPPEFPRRVAGEMWLYPDGSRVMELSTKCPPSETFQVATEAKTFLHGRGIDVTADMETKTATALRFFSSELRPG